jgi:hypothetical protein
MLQTNKTTTATAVTTTTTTVTAIQCNSVPESYTGWA